jgi:fructokinase
MDIVCLGEALIDMFPVEVGRKLVEVSAFQPKPGGAPANVAVAAARLGMQVAFIGKVGDDIFGHFLADVLQKEGVNISGLRFDPDHRTTMAIIAMPDENTAEFVFYRNPGADLMLRSDELERTLLETARVLHFGSLSLVDEPARSTTQCAVEQATAAGALISFDVNYRPSLWRSPDEALKRIRAILPQAHLLKINEVELKLLAGGGDLEDACLSLLDQGPELVVVTLGEQGSFFRTREASAFAAAFKVHTVDAIGCGDAFVAGLLSQLITGESWRNHFNQVALLRTLRYANAVGALTALQRGVIPALPTAAQVEAFLSTQPK